MNPSGGPAQNALLHSAGEALSRHDPQTALGLINQADRMGPTHHGFLNRALALRMLGDLPGALAALDDALAIKNADIAEELALPPVKIHCSILAEEAIKAAVADYRARHPGAGAAGLSEQPACTPTGH